ncbi:MAG: alpha-L-fucosidase [Verrucomicrobiota bacterium]
MIHAIDPSTHTPEEIDSANERAAIGTRHTRDNYWNHTRFQRIPFDRDRERRLQCWREARFGMMIHWGPAAQIGRHPRVIINEEADWSLYDRAIEEWNPRADCAEEWMRLEADSGARYAVMIAKYHDGFCLWDTKQTDFNSVQRGPQRDFLREYAEAARRHDIQPGVYFSLWDIHHPATARAKEDESARRELVDFAHAQIEELMTQYGEWLTLWFDVPTPLSPEGWERDVIIPKILDWQPGIVINDRMGTPEDYATMDYGCNPTQDFSIGEPGRDWEVTLPTTRYWAFVQGTEDDTIDARRFLDILQTACANGGNVMLDTGPLGDGSIPPGDSVLFRKLGRWLQAHGEAVFGADLQRIGRNLHISLPSFRTGEWTSRPGIAYAWLSQWFGETRVIGNFSHTVRKATLLTTGQAVDFEQEGSRLILKNLPPYCPDPVLHCPVVRLDLLEQNISSPEEPGVGVQKGT